MFDRYFLKKNIVLLAVFILFLTNLSAEDLSSKVLKKYVYEQIVPYEGTVGSYITYSAEILDEEDSFLKRAIKE